MDERERQLAYIEKCRELYEKKVEELGRKLSFHVTTFGCQMNARDSEKLCGILESIGYVQEDEEEKADLILFNTCTVRDNANQRVYGHLGVLKKYKRLNPELKIGICGCMMQEKTAVEKIRKSYPYVDIIFGTHNVFKLAEIMYHSYTSEGMIIDLWEETEQIVEDLPVDRKYSFKSGVNIMFGCNNFCSYCIVPYVRGRERSRRPSDIVTEIEKLVADGVVEVMLLGQNVNSYGLDFVKKQKNGTLEEDVEVITFPELLKRIEKIDGLKRIRFMTSHPKDLSDELIEVMKNSKKICHHMHLPLQSGSSRLLADMNRHYTKEQYVELALKLRREIPDIAITTDIIVGYPGETKEDVDETLDVIRTVQYDNAFTFQYSKRTGTPAAAREDQVEKAQVQEQFDRVLSLVQETSKARTALLEGQVLSALVEDVDEQQEGYVTGRLGNNNCVHFPGSIALIGSIVEVKLTKCMGFYYIGEMV